MITGASVESSIGVVAADPVEASEIGARVLEAGGNAMDAAAAAAIACCVARPDMTGIGGYMMAATVHDESTGETVCLDSNSVAPAAAHEHMYTLLPVRDGEPGINEAEYLCSVEHDANLFGGASVSVPGVMAGVGTLSERWGRLPWREIVLPSAELVASGVRYSAELVNSIAQMAPVLGARPDTARVLAPDGDGPEVGEMWRRPDFADTLRRLADRGWRDFYEGELAAQIVEAINADGGRMSAVDLARFEPRVVEPYSVSFRDAEVFGPVLANGSISSLQVLALLDTLAPRSMDDPAYWNAFAEALKIAWRDRLRLLGDPAFVDVDVDELLSPVRAAAQTEPLRADPYHCSREPIEPSDHLHGTLHVSAADSEGNVVAVTLTHGALFGSCVVVPGTGMLLGHGMSRFDPRPGRPNSIAPGKQPLNNVAPLITTSGDRVIASGLPGGRRIISVSAQLVHRLVEHDVGPAEAVATPRLHAAHHGLEVMADFPDDALQRLRQVGNQVTVMDRMGGGAMVAEVDRASGHTRAAGSAGRSAAAGS